MFQIADIGVGAVSQNTRSKTVTISRDKHVVLLWTSTRPQQNIFLLCAAAGEGFLTERPTICRLMHFFPSGVHIIRE
jgi:hypothetical protein